MAASSQYLAEALLAYMLQNPATPIAKPATIYMALCTTVPTSATAGTEVTGGGYARVAVTTSATNFTIATNVATNGIALTFPRASASWGTVVAYQFYDAATAGNPLFYGTLTTSQTINAGSTPSFAAGQLTVNMN